MDPTPASCEQSCQGIGEMFPECVQQWNALNHCMAEDDLICDSTGSSATRACVSLADVYGNWLVRRLASERPAHNFGAHLKNAGAHENYGCAQMRVGASSVRVSHDG